MFNSNGEVYENACDLPPAAETVVTVTRAVDEERDVFNSNGEVYENACDLPPAAETGGSDTGCRGGEGCV